MNALLTVEQAAKLLGIGRSHIYQLISKGQLETVRLGRCRRIRPEAVEALVHGLISEGA
jgi:excisionase family DNA binding protein